MMAVQDGPYKCLPTAAEASSVKRPRAGGRPVNEKMRECSSIGRALALQARSCRFESDHFHCGLGSGPLRG